MTHYNDLCDFWQINTIRIRRKLGYDIPDEETDVRGSDASIREAILDKAPEDGSTIGNVALFAALQALHEDIMKEDYWRVRDALVAEGVLAKSKKHGDSVYRTNTNEPTQNAIQKHALMISCSDSITPQFIQAGFVASEPYEDGIGGTVIDYIRSEERITFITDENGILIMYMDSGEFRSRRYDHSLSSIPKVSEFVQDQFCKKSTAANQNV